MIRKVTFLVFAFLMVGYAAMAQIVTPVKWSYAAKKLNKNEAMVLIKATIDKGWHIYSLNVKDGGPEPTSFKFAPSKAYTIVVKTIEPKPLIKFEKAFNMNVSFFEKSVVFQQKIKLNAPSAVVKGKLEFMACDDHRCLPPEEVEFSIPVK